LGFWGRKKQGKSTVAGAMKTKRNENFGWKKKAGGNEGHGKKKSDRSAKENTILRLLVSKK